MNERCTVVVLSAALVASAAATTAVPVRTTATAPAEASTAAAESLRDLAEGGHWKRLRSIVETRVKANPNDAEALWLLAQVREAFGDYEGALPFAERAVALDGRNPAYHLEVASVCGSLTQLAGILKKMSLATRTKSEMQAALNADPRHVDSLRGWMDLLWEAPGFFGGDKDKARETARRITEIDPARGYLAQAELARRDNKSDGLEALYRKAVEADQRNYEALTALASFLLSRPTPQFAEAERHVREAIGIAPDRSNGYNILVRLCVSQQRMPDLEAALAQAERHVPDNPAPFLTAANALLAAHGDMSRAETYVRTYLRQEPEGGTVSHGIARWRLALVLERQGRLREAVTELETAAKLEPKRDAIAKDLKRLRSHAPQQKGRATADRHVADRGPRPPVQLTAFAQGNPEPVEGAIATPKTQGVRRERPTDTGSGSRS